eukprot:560139-Pelagomonas_calceolata.AAC.7
MQQELSACTKHGGLHGARRAVRCTHPLTCKCVNAHQDAHLYVELDDNATAETYAHLGKATLPTLRINACNSTLQAAYPPSRWIPNKSASPTSSPKRSAKCHSLDRPFQMVALTRN